MNYMKRYYGIDFLSIFLLILSFLFGIWHRTSSIALILFIYSVFRIFSKNLYRRQKEYDLFYTYANKIVGKLGFQLPYNTIPLNFNFLTPYINNVKYKISQNKNFKITKCPYCGQKLRLPRGKGKITVTCKKCLRDFKFKT